ncbi:transmembrane protein 272-like isoform X2 [Corticium candelabrum]|uniref:transmembrane protein 272-like isoform X2 n=1 Tax=Corticium candelabrum TaxID=121492 RepID=UPI002E26F18C|nr:transmembrane protein 272-like isoform X2 [Corticium candelabrum]
MREPLHKSSSLPSYSQVEGRSAISDAPPSYESLFGRIRHKKETASSPLDFLAKMCYLLGGTIVCTVLVTVFMALPVSMVVMGALYKDDCKYQKYIPIYLIVGGAFGIVRTLWTLCQKMCRSGEREEDEENRKMNPIEMILNCFMLAWFITGSVWIYSIYSSYNNVEGTAHYCNNTLYLYAFWITNATYILLGSICFCTCCLFICAMMVG